MTGFGISNHTLKAASMRMQNSENILMMFNKVASLDHTKSIAPYLVE